MSSPAERLAATKRRQRPKRKHHAPQRETHWTCGVRELRESLGLSQRDVCSACGLSNATLVWVEGGYDVRLTTARRIAAFFGTTTDKLWLAKEDDQ